MESAASTLSPNRPESGEKYGIPVPAGNRGNTRIQADARRVDGGEEDPATGKRRQTQSIPFIMTVTEDQTVRTREVASRETASEGGKESNGDPKERTEKRTRI